MKFSCIISILLFFALACSSEENKSIIGEWEATDEHNGQIDKYVFNIEEGFFGGLNGSIKTYINDSALPTTQINQIDYKHPNFTFYINPGGMKIKFTGIVSNNKLIGKFSYSDPSIKPKELVLSKTTKNIERKIYQYTKPESVQFNTSSLSDVNMNTEIISNLIQKINDGDFGETNSILILKNNKLVLEEYFNGFNHSKLHHIQSCTKSITSLLIGIAIDKEIIKSVNEKVEKYLREFKFAKGWENVSIKNLLTMSSGVEWVKKNTNSIWDKDKGVASILNKPIVVSPGTKFEYNSAMQVLAKVIENATKTDLIKFAHENLFTPLNIKEFKWERSKIDSLPLCNGALFLLPIDMLKIGQLILQKGKFNNKQVVSENWINESTKVQIEVPDNRGDNYGYLWWISTKGERKVFAHGIGGQFIFIIPQHNLIVVTTGNNIHNNKRLASFEILNDYILQSM